MDPFIFLVDEPEFLTLEEVAAKFKVSKAGLNMQRQRGKFPGVLGVKVGNRVIFRRTDLERWVEEQVAKQTQGTTFGYWQTKLREARDNGH